MLSQSPTLAHTGTVAGVILGTAAYMSPEQARGKRVDRRADVWSFGVLLWEMLTGRTLFAGDTVTDVIAAVVTKEPDLEALPARTPRAVRRLLSRCLRKDPRTRLPDIGAARLELSEVIAGTADTDAPAADGTAQSGDERRRRVRERWAWAAVALVASGLASALAFVHLREVEEPKPAARFTVEAPEGWTFALDFGWPLPSPDGRQVVFRALPLGREGAGGAMLWVRPLESLTARPLAGTEGVTSDIPAWSPDGRSLAFVVAGELRRLNLSDGTVQRICAMPGSGNGGTDWSAAGTILFSAGGGAGIIYSVAATGGDAKPLTALDRGEANHHAPQFLPDGRRFLFLIGGGEKAGVYVASLGAPKERQLVVTGAIRRVYAAGHLLFVRDGTLLAQPFDPEKAALSGGPVAIASSVATWASGPAYAWFDVSPAGTLAYLSGGGASSQVQLAWVDRKGAPVATVGAPGDYGQFTLSPDGRKVALEVRDAKREYDVWVMDAARGVASRVTDRAGDDRDPVWSRDGRSLVFSAMGAEKGVLRRKGLRAADPETLLTESADEDHPEYWSRDEETLLFVRRTADDAQSVWALSLKSGKVEPVFDARFRVDEPQLSPDERWLAYVSQESGRDEVYLEPFRRAGDRVRVSVDGGGQPKWRGDGKELFYTTPGNLLMAATVRTAGERLEVSLPTKLFEIRGLQGTGYDDYAPSPDGQRFLVKQPVEESRKPQLQIITNWTSLVRP